MRGHYIVEDKEYLRLGLILDMEPRPTPHDAASTPINHDYIFGVARFYRAYSTELLPTIIISVQKLIETWHQTDTNPYAAKLSVL